MDFLDLNYAKFVPVQFKKGGNGEAALQRLPVHDSMFSCEDYYFFGFKFTVPTW